MKTRTTIVVAVLAALCTLTPAVAIVALGAYGSALGGLSRVTAASGAQIRISPQRGSPGTLVRVEGERLPPRSEVSLFVTIERDVPERLRLRLDRGVTSRDGKFGLDVVLPSSLVRAGTERIWIDAEVMPSGREPIRTALAQFELTAFSNQLTVKVVDAASGSPLAGAVVEAKDLLGRALLTASSGPDGRATLQNLRPGLARVEVRMLDHLQASAEVEVPEAGGAEVAVLLKPDANRRLYLPFVGSAGENMLSVAGFDRASGLRSNLTVGIPPSRARLSPAADSVDPQLTNFHFLIADNSGASAARPGAEAASSLHAAFNFFRAAGIGNVRRDEGYNAPVWYVGRSARGEVLLVAGVAAGVTQADFYAIDPQTGGIRALRRDLSVFSMPPVMSAEGTRYYLVLRDSRRLQEVDIDSGRVLAEVRGLPEYALRLAPASSGDLLYLLTADGGVHRIDLRAGRVEGPIAEAPGATWLSLSGDQQRLYLVGPELEALLTIDLSRPATVGLAPLAGSAYWVWADPTGPFVFAGWIKQPEVIVVDAKTLTVAGRFRLTDGLGEFTGR